MPAALQSIDLASWQEHFDFLLPRRPMLRPDEVATALGIDVRTVLRLFEEGKLLGHEYNAAAGERMHRRYRREAVILLLAKTANYAPSDLRNRVLEIISQLPRADKAAVYQALGRSLSQ